MIILRVVMPGWLILALALCGASGTQLATAAMTKSNFTASADAYVDSANPAKNYGTSNALRAGTSPIERSYLRFNLEGLNGSVTRVTLRLYAKDKSKLGFDVRGVADNGWDELTLTYENAPPVGSVVASSGRFSAGHWITVDVTPLMTGNGVFSLALDTTSTASFKLASRESGGKAPQLIVEAQSPLAATPTSTLTSTATPTALPTSTPTSTPVTTALPTGTPTALPAVTATPTATPTSMSMATGTPTALPAVTATPTSMSMATGTPTALPAGTRTSTPVRTSTRTSTPVPPSTPTSGAAFYVAPTGNDNNPGTFAMPWLTIQKAANTMTAGGTVTVLPGNYQERVQVTRSGASGAPITFRAQGTVTMKGFTVIASYISLIGFDITNTADNWQSGWGIFVEGTNCLLQGNYVHFATRGGITLWARPGSETQTGNCIVRNNRLYRNAMAGMEIGGRNNLIEGNEVWGTIQYHPSWINPPSYVDADGIRFFGIGHTIRNNYIHDISFRDPENVNPHIDCFQTWSNSGYEAAQNVILEKNFCVNLEYKASVGTGQGFMLANASNLIIRNNIIWAFRGVNAVGGQNLTIVNNTLASDLSYPPSVGPSGVSLTQAPNTVVKNNIFYNFPAPYVWVPDSASKQALDVGYNLIYRSDGKTPSGSPDPYGLWGVNPMLVNPAGGDFHFQPNSPAINAGVALTSVTDDFDGTVRPQGPKYDIGAYEFLP